MFEKIGKRRIIVLISCVLLFIALAVLVALFTNVPASNDFESMVNTYTRNKPYVRLSVSVIRENTTDITVYGHDSRIVNTSGIQYEIGQITESFLGALIAREITNGTIGSNDCISTYIPVPSGSYDPTIIDLVTNTSAYSNFKPDSLGKGGNPYSGFTDFNVLMSVADYTPDTDGPYIYSDSPFGASVLGVLLGDLYNESFYTVLSNFIHLDMGLRNTYIGSSGTKVHGGYSWQVNDSYIAYSGLTSTIEDLSTYVRSYLLGGIDYFDLSVSPITEVNADTDSGFFWKVSRDDETIFMHGDTKNYASEIVIDKSNGVAVIVLSNYPDDKYGSVSALADALLEVSNG